MNGKVRFQAEIRSRFLDDAPSGFRHTSHSKKAKDTSKGKGLIDLLFTDKLREKYPQTNIRKINRRKVRVRDRFGTETVPSDQASRHQSGSAMQPVLSFAVRSLLLLRSEQTVSQPSYPQQIPLR